MGNRWRALVVRTVVVVSASLVAAGIPAVTSPAGAVGDPSGEDGVVLDLDRYSDLLLDEASGRILVSDGSSILVTDLTGTTVDRLTGLAGVSDLVQDPATGTVYAALTRGAGIAAIDASTLEVTVLPTGNGSCPDELAIDQGIVWAHDSCSDGFWSLDPADGSVVAVADLAIDEVELATGPALLGRLFVGHPGSDSRVFAFDTAGRTLTEVATHEGAAWWPHDVTVSPDGTQLAWAYGFLRTADLSEVPTQYSPGRNGALAYRADGAILTGEAALSGRSPDGRSYYEPAPITGHVVHAGVAWGGTTAYAIAKKQDVFRLFARDLGFKTRIQVHADHSGGYKYGDRAILTVKLRGADAGDVVRVFAQREGLTRAKLIAEGPVDADGVLTTSYPMFRATTFTADFPGDPDDEQNPSTSDPVERSVRQEITATAKRYSHLDGSVAVYRPGGRAWFGLRARPVYPKNCTVTTIEAKLDGRWRTVAGTDCVRMPSNGRFTLYLDDIPELRGRLLRLQSWLYPQYGDAGVASTRWVWFRFGR